MANYDLNFLDEENKKKTKPTKNQGILSTTINPQSLIGISSNVPVATANRTTLPDNTNISSTLINAVQGEQQSSQQGGFLSGLFGGISNAFSGISKWAQQNPALFTGLTTGILGASQGMSGLAAMGAGGQAGAGVQNEMQRQYEELLKISAMRANKQQQNEKDVANTLKDELDLYGPKLNPQQRQQYINLRLSGQRPTYNPGVLGFGAGFQ